MGFNDGAFDCSIVGFDDALGRNDTLDLDHMVGFDDGISDSSFADGALELYTVGCVS